MSFVNIFSQYVTCLFILLIFFLILCIYIYIYIYRERERERERDHFYWIYYIVASVLCFGILALQGMWDLSSLTRDQTFIPCVGRWSLNHWTTREVPMYTIYVQKKPGFILEIWGNIENLDVKIDTKNVPRGNCLVIWSITKELSVLQEAK